jgi:5'-nucleotidase
MHLIDRRQFIERLLAGAPLLSGTASLHASAPEPAGVTILSTNDTHSRLDPFPPGSGELAGLGGVARRKTLVDRLRREEPGCLLVDAGDFLQGTPYFNLYDGLLEIEAMNRIGYDVGTIGNHEFDKGVDGLVAILEKAAFPFVSANLDPSGTPLAGHWTPHHILIRGDQRIGLFGLAPRLAGLVPEPLWRGIRWRHPIPAAQEAISALRRSGATRIVCLSHLGMSDPLAAVDPEIVTDPLLVRGVPGLDLVIGGHSHSWLSAGVRERAPDGRLVPITQQGWGGTRVGRIRLPAGGGEATASARLVAPGPLARRRLS